MSITIDPALESQLRSRAAAGVGIEVYVERLVRADRQAGDELEALAMDGLRLGEPIEPGPGYWEEKHRRLDERIGETRGR